MFGVENTSGFILRESLAAVENFNEWNLKGIPWRPAACKQLIQ